MKIIIANFVQGMPVVFPVADLDKFRKEVLKIDILFEYDLEYEGEEVRVRRRMKK
jgi:hypothetical protein